MDITGINNLWKDYDPTALPLNVTPLSERVIDGVKTRDFYYDGFTIVDGRVRAYIKVSENPDPKGTVLYLSDNKNGLDPTPRALYAQGYSVAELDYLGFSDNSPRFSLYPKQLNSCNLRGKDAFEAPADAQNSCWFVWTCMARRAIMLLKEHYGGEIFALGKGLGGATVYKLCIFDDGLTAAATMLNVLPDVTGAGNRMINYRAALDNVAYASLCKVPLFMAVASNDEDRSFDSMSELANDTESLYCFRVVERAFSSGIAVVQDQIGQFFENCTGKTYPKLKIKASNSENNLYFNIIIDNVDVDSAAALKVELLAAFSITNATYRNWTRIKTVGLGNNEHFVKVDVLNDTRPVYAFANVTDADGFTVSSPLLSVIPKSLGIPPIQKAHRRLLYDGSLGTDVWMSPNGAPIDIKAGPFGIEGVTSKGNCLATFKPGDILYRAEKDTLLQLILNGKPQTVEIEVSDENERYSCKVDIPNSDEWHKFTLSHSDFKGPNSLLDWSKAVLLQFNASDELIISSVLWV